jgi:hypothetical protein
MRDGAVVAEEPFPCGDMAEDIRDGPSLAQGWLCECCIVERAGEGPQVAQLVEVMATTFVDVHLDRFALYKDKARSPRSALRASADHSRSA